MDELDETMIPTGALGDLRDAKTVSCTTFQSRTASSWRLFSPLAARKDAWLPIAIGDHDSGD